MKLFNFDFKSEQGIFYCIYKNDSISSLNKDNLDDISVAYLGVGKKNYENYLEKLKKIYPDLDLQYKNNSSISSEIIDYLEGKKSKFNIKTFFLTGTEFEQTVWIKAKEIVYGQTISYKGLSEKVAKSIGKPKSYRAVGNALGKNPLILLVPCHRIIKSNGDIGNFSSGIPLKIMLLELESKTNLAHKDLSGRQ